MPRFYTQNYSLYRAGKVFIAFADLSRKTIRIALLVGLTLNRRVHIMGLNEWRFCSTLMFQKCFKHDFDLIEIVISVVMVRKLNWSKHIFHCGSWSPKSRTGIRMKQVDGNFGFLLSIWTLQHPFNHKYIITVWLKFNIISADGILYEGNCIDFIDLSISQRESYFLILCWNLWKKRFDGKKKRSQWDFFLYWNAIKWSGIIFITLWQIVKENVVFVEFGLEFVLLILTWILCDIEMCISFFSGRFTVKSMEFLEHETTCHPQITVKMPNNDMELSIVDERFVR